MTTIAIVGLGYFSQLHQAAWASHSGAGIVGVTDLDPVVTRSAATSLGVPGFADLVSLLERCNPDIVDIVAPPASHADLVRQALKPGRTIVCQKPFCTSLDEAQALVDEADFAKTSLVIHENFRFQPWYRDIKAFLDDGKMGRVFQCRFDLRPGDGRGPDAYLARQPAFRSMPHLLIHETGVHFIDVFRWLFGEITNIYADLRHLNPVIAGEDAGLMILSHADGTQSVFDGNRLADMPTRQPRLTMGEMRIEGEAGTLMLDGDGALRFRRFGDADAHPVSPRSAMEPDAFGGGCVATLIDHVLQSHIRGTEPENTAADYLAVIRASNAAYRSHAEGRRIDL